MNKLIIALIVLCFITAYFLFLRMLLSSKDRPEIFTYFVRKYENKDQSKPPIPEPILFTGSSIMKYWKSLKEDMAPLPVLNRALASSKITEVAHFVDRLVIPYQPKAVVLYAGSNDIQGRKPRTPDQVLEGFKLFVDKVYTVLPSIYFTASVRVPLRIFTRQPCSGWP